MSESVYTTIEDCARFLKVDLSAGGMAAFADAHSLDDRELEVIRDLFEHLRDRKEANVIEMQLKLSHLPLKAPKTFDNFDFDYLHVRGKDAAALKNLPTLSTLYSRRNLAFIGPTGVGKTHLAMAFGRACCEKGLKTAFLKGTELRDKFIHARNTGRIGTLIASLVKPSCLIIDEVGRCKFDHDCTEMFFDVIDRRYHKEGPNTMIFTSNTLTSQWGQFFEGDESLLCALDRAFDDATVFVMRGASYRGRGLESVAVEAGPKAIVQNKNVK